MQYEKSKKERADSMIEVTHIQQMFNDISEMSSEVKAESTQLKDVINDILHLEEIKLAMD
jgi:hypothetical protein